MVDAAILSGSFLEMLATSASTINGQSYTVAGVETQRFIAYFECAVCPIPFCIYIIPMRHNHSFIQPSKSIHRLLVRFCHLDLPII